MMANRRRSLRFAPALAACLLMLMAAPGVAQLGGGIGGRPGSKPPKAGGGGIKMRTPEESGSYFGAIRSFKLDDSGRDDDLFGTLTIKPFRKDRKILKLRVFLRDGLSIRIGRMAIEPDQFVEMLTKGLHCTANWQVERSDDEGRPKRATKYKKKDLVSLLISALDVQGKISKIDGDVITLRVKPRGGNDWPDKVDQASGVTRSGKTTPMRKRKVRSKSLKLRIIDDLAELRDGADEDVEFGDLEIGQLIEASVVSAYPKIGYVTRLKTVDALQKEDDSGRTNPPSRRGGRPGGKRG